MTLEFYEYLQKMYCKIIFFLAIDTTLGSDNPLCFRKTKERFGINIKAIMEIDDKIRDEKLQYNIYREAAKASTLS